ncbi:MAG: hypothetical protein RL654_1136 [Pseudomonadota bacterium]|jgi:DNA-binding transcriptional LysR family regulator
MTDLSTRQLRAFLTLADSASFTRAAATCHLSQPAFSALIRGLEDQVGLRLFDRSTRHVALTHEGAALRPRAQRLLEEFDAALEGLRELAARERGRVSIALLPSLAAGWLPEVLAGFRSRWPGIALSVADVLSEPCIERVQRGEADFALAAVRADTPELQAEPFCTDRFHLVLPAGHRLTQGPMPTPADLNGEAFIHLSRTSSVRQYIEAALHPQVPTATLEVEQLATVAGMVRAGLGLSIVPALTLYQFQEGQLVTRPLAWPGLARQIYLVRRRDRGLSVAAQALHDWLTAHPPAP